MQIRIKNEEITEDLHGNIPIFPKYTTQIMNLANQNAQATRPRNVGQLSDLIIECPYNSLQDWETWYLEKYSNSLDEATDKILEMVDKFKEAIESIERNVIYTWVHDLVITKTFTGLKFQESILKRISKHKNLSYRLAVPQEEAKGIDGYIGDEPVSIKPETYQSKPMLPENIIVNMIYYKKTKTGINVSFNF